MNDERYRLGNVYRVPVDMLTNVHQRTIFTEHLEPLPDCSLDGMTMVIDYVYTNSNYDYLPCSTTTRSQFDLTTQADNSDKLQKRTWSYMNCDHRRCTRSVNTIPSFYRASEVHGMYIYLDLDRAFISRCARGTCYFVVYRALVVDMHGTYCYIIVYRHARHIRLSFVSPCIR